MNSANLTLIYIPEKIFEVKDNITFDPPMLDINCEEKKLITEAIVKMLKKMADISNSSLNKNADGLLSRKLAEMKVEWIGKSKTRLLSIKYKVSY